jgi:hypothetical protein
MAFADTKIPLSIQELEAILEEDPENDEIDYYSSSCRHPH